MQKGLILLAIALATQAHAQAIEHTLDGHARHALHDIETTVDVGDRPYVRYLSFWAVKDEEKLEKYYRFGTYWINMMSFARGVYKPSIVPQSDNKLWRVDIRDFRWNVYAWSAVGNRDPYAQEPWVSSKVAGALREYTCDCQDETLVKKGIFPVVSMVSGPWFLRETLETNRSPSYYDLLFARQRFKAGAKAEQKWREQERVISWRGGYYKFPDDSGRYYDNLKPGRYRMKFRYKVQGEAKHKVQFVDFPRNEDDWNEAFGIAEVKSFLAKQKLNLTLGAVAPGSEDEPAGKGSIVARNNRAVLILPSPFGPAFQTLDAKATAGEKDYVETAPDVVFGKAKFDAGELLAPLPNGGQAGLLINAERKRVEIATGEFVHNRLDKRYDDVRTNVHCANCHARDYGFIEPRNLIEEFYKDGGKFVFKDPKTGKRLKQKENEFNEFFRGWKAKGEAWRTEYKAFVRKCTTVKGKEPWDGVKLADTMLELRDEYDAPVTMETALAEIGYEPDQVKLALSKSPNVRLWWLLIKGKPIPRLAWEGGKFREAALLMHLSLPGKR